MEAKYIPNFEFEIKKNKLLMCFLAIFIVLFFVCDFEDYFQQFIYILKKIAYHKHFVKKNSWSFK